MPTIYRFGLPLIRSLECNGSTISIAIGGWGDRRPMDCNGNLKRNQIFTQTDRHEYSHDFAQRTRYRVSRASGA